MGTAHRGSKEGSIGERGLNGGWVMGQNVVNSAFLLLFDKNVAFISVAIIATRERKPRVFW